MRGLGLRHGRDFLLAGHFRHASMAPRRSTENWDRIRAAVKTTFVRRFGKQKLPASGPAAWFLCAPASGARSPLPAEPSHAPVTRSSLRRAATPLKQARHEHIQAKGKPTSNRARSRLCWKARATRSRAKSVPADIVAVREGEDPVVVELKNRNFRLSAVFTRAIERQAITERGL